MHPSDYPETRVVSREPCPKCGSTDNVARYDDGHAWCFSQGCGYFEKPSGEGSSSFSAEETAREEAGLLSGMVPETGLPARRLTMETCRRWGYLIGTLNDEPVQLAEYRDRSGRVVAQKVRKSNKDFFVKGDLKKAGLFGDHLWGGGKKLVITEGEIDAMSVSQVQNHRWPVVSVPNGASGAKKSLLKALDFLEQFEEIVLMFDMDDAGREAAAEVAMALGGSLNVKIASLPLKDPNECLKEGRGDEIVRAIWDAKAYRPDGILAASDLRELIRVEPAAATVNYPWEGLNKLTRGARRGELVTLTAGSGIGKSAVIREIAYHFHMKGQRVGMIMLEESPKRTIEGMIGLHINKPIHISRDGVSLEELDTAFSDLFAERELFLYDHFGSTEIDNIISRIRYLAKAMDCGWIFLDHLSILISGLHTADERKMIDEAMTKLRTLVQETGIGCFLVSHLTRPEGNRGHEDGAGVHLKQLRGSHAIPQLSDMVIGLERDQRDEKAKTVTKVIVLKNRFTGETGEAGYLRYDTTTGRLSEFEPTFEGVVDHDDF